MIKVGQRQDDKDRRQGQYNLISGLMVEWEVWTHYGSHYQQQGYENHGTQETDT
jgi:hypothetical protein